MIRRIRDQILDFHVRLHLILVNLWIRHIIQKRKPDTAELPIDVFKKDHELIKLSDVALLASTRKT